MKLNINCSLTANEIHDGILGAPRGTKVIYHRGMLARDCGGALERDASWSERAAREARGAAWALHEGGHCVLTQRRLGVLDYEYIATARAA